MKSIDVLPALRKEKDMGLQGRAKPATLCTVLPRLMLAALFALAVVGTAPAAGGDIEMGTGRMGSIGTDPDSGDRLMTTPSPVPQQQDQGPQTIIVSPEIDLQRPGYGPTPPRPYPPGPRPYGPPGRGAPYPLPPPRGR